jgi:hypothetical protein
MKFFHAAAFAVILTVAGSPVLRAQEPDEKEKAKQQEEEKKKQPPPAKEKPQPKPDERPKAEPDKNKPRQEPDRQSQPQKEDGRTTRGNQDRQAPQANRNENAQHGGRTNVRRIPEESFRVSFGREHHFRVARRDDRRFEYGGYGFEYVDAWPSGWSYDDDCYIEQDGDDYYLVDPRHPGVRVLVVIVG